jgi:uncharacterized membrane protein YbhN (UPF0104 family)
MLAASAALRVRRLSEFLGLAIGLAGILFVVRVLNLQWSVVVSSVQAADLAILLLAFLLGLAGMTQIGLGWRRALALVGEQRPVADTLFRYFVGQLGKYVPGGIWPVLGRSEMARRAGISAKAAYSSTLLSLGATYLAAIMTAVLAFPLGLDESSGPSVPQIWVLALLPFGLLALHPRVLSLLNRAGTPLTGAIPTTEIPAWRVSLRLVARHIPAWLAISFATMAVSIALGGAGDVWNLVFATSLSWVVGFLIVPVPGGLGVREAVFIATATSLTPALAATVAVTARLLFVAIDATAAIAFSFYSAVRGDGSIPEDVDT